MTVRLIAGTLIALTVVNAYSFVRLYASTYSIVDRRPSLATVERGPASIPTGGPIEADSLKSRLSLDLNCRAQKEEELKVQGQWTQLRGRLCGLEKLKSVEILNLANGFTASVFSLGLQQYQTDLIQLNRGRNLLRVRLIPYRGPVEEKTLIVRSDSI
jgi:hypothetical protein